MPKLFDVVKIKGHHKINYINYENHNYLCQFLKSNFLLVPNRIEIKEKIKLTADVISAFRWSRTCSDSAKDFFR